MKINLIQIHAADWASFELAYYLRQSGEADLTVFPESFPFGNYARPILHSTAKSRLEKCSKYYKKKCTFIAGGYVLENETKRQRNRSYLVSNGKVVDFYDKRKRFQHEVFVSGRTTKAFAWVGQRDGIPQEKCIPLKCIPLICADACDGPASRFMERVVNRGKTLIANARKEGCTDDMPIVVCSYGAFLTKPYWTDSLQHLANECSTPLVICNIAGWSESRFLDSPEDDGDNKWHQYGGGGSGLFLPKSPSQQFSTSQQFEEPGIISIDTREKRATWEPFRLRRR